MDLILFNLIDCDSDKDEDYFLMFFEEFSKEVKLSNCFSPLNIEMFIKADFEKDFRFSLEDFLVLYQCLQIPEYFYSENRYKVYEKVGLLIVLNLLSFPKRLRDTAKLFKRSISYIYTFFNIVLVFIYNKYKHLLNWDCRRITFEKCKYFSHKIYKKTQIDLPFVGFIEGAVRPCFRPIENQNVVYNGYKCTHALKYQGVVMVDGICVHLSGPYAGVRHDSGMYDDSNLYSVLVNNLNFEGNQFLLYGDSGYSLSEVIKIPHPSTTTNPLELETNLKMKSVRISVEWYFGKIVSLFAYIDFKINQKLLLNTVGIQYPVSVILTN